MPCSANSTATSAQNRRWPRDAKSLASPKPPAIRAPRFPMVFTSFGLMAPSSAGTPQNRSTFSDWLL